MTRKIPDDAFERYVALGPGRSYRLLAQSLGVSKRGITKHAAQERWAERLGKIEQEARVKSDEKLVDVLGEARERHLKTVRAMQARALDALRKYPLNSGMEAVKAAELAIKLERIIVGEPSERTSVDIADVTRKEMERWLTTRDDSDEAEPERDEDDGIEPDEEDPPKACAG